MLFCRMTSEMKKIKSVNAEARIKWWKLKKEEPWAEFRKELRQARKSQEGVWCASILWIEERGKGDLMVQERFKGRAKKK